MFIVDCQSDVYLVGTVMLIFGMGLYGLFISNCIEPIEEKNDRALKNTTLFGMFPLTVSKCLIPELLHVRRFFNYEAFSS